MTKRFFDHTGNAARVHMAFVDALISVGATLALFLALDAGFVATAVACVVALCVGWVIGFFWADALLSLLAVLLDAFSGIAWVASMVLLIGAAIFTSVECLLGAILAFVLATALHYWGPDP